MHSTKSGMLVHPIDEPLRGYAGNYSKYVSSGIMTGSPASSYLSLVPFATNDWLFSTLTPLADPASPTTGSAPGTTDKVMCLSCHRAHASGFPEALRWNTESEFITAVDNTSAVIWPGTDAAGGASKGSNGRTSLEQKAAYYDRPATVFGAYQRQLCNKCHAKD
jgi:predicted CXXCH cytochrome family protein